MVAISKKVLLKYLMQNPVIGNYVLHNTNT